MSFLEIQRSKVGCIFNGLQRTEEYSFCFLWLNKSWSLVSAQKKLLFYPSSRKRILTGAQLKFHSQQVHVDSIAIVHTIHRCPKPVFRTHKDSATAESYLICTRSWTSLKLSQQNIKGRKHLDTEMETTTVALASLPSVYHLFTAVLISPVQSIVHSTVQSRVQSPESRVQSPTFIETLLL